MMFTHALANRVDPWGSLIRTPARGTMLGNRGGTIHNDAQEIVRPFKSKQWIVCLLEFKNRKRTVMSPRLYTELFFLDEATAFAAGHRPCAECRRQSFNVFRAAWKRAGLHGDRIATAPEIDAMLHPARINQAKHKVTFEAPLDTLPDGAFISIGIAPENAAYLVRGSDLLRWSPEGYTEKLTRPRGEMATVLTPKPLIECLRHGYEPGLHPSALI